MNPARAPGAMLSMRLGDHTRSLRRLSRRDFGVLVGRMPLDKDGVPFKTIFAVHAWGVTAEGAPVVIAVASLPADYAPEQLDERIAEVSSEDGAWGSITAQVEVAAHITAESLTHGDRKHGKGEGKQRADPSRMAGTTPARRSGWLATVRGWVTPGR